MRVYATKSGRFTMAWYPSTIIVCGSGTREYKELLLDRLMNALEKAWGVVGSRENCADSGTKRKRMHKICDREAF
jgi:hypothetical protein